MSQSLTNAAAASIKPAHAAYYGKIDAKNPVILAAETELKEVVEYFTKKGTKPPKSGPNEIASRGSVIFLQFFKIRCKKY